MSDTVSANPHRGKAFWLDHVQRWQNSGLSKIAYCNQHNLKSSNFYNWSRPVVLQSLSDQMPKHYRISRARDQGQLRSCL